MERSLPDSAALRDFFDRLASASGSVLLLDYDGTLAPFQIERENAYPYPQVVPFLDRIIRTGKTRLVIVTGRRVADLDTFLQPLNNLEIWGAHGLEHLLPDGSYQQARISSRALELLSLAKEWVIASKLISAAEFKPGGIAIHWRGMPELEAGRLEAELRNRWSGLAINGELKLLSFESGMELRVVRPDKGDAVASIVKETGPVAPIAYLGDDLTDEDSFRALDGRGLTVLVRPEFRETHAQVWLRPPQELIGFLESWSNRVSQA